MHLSTTTVAFAILGLTSALPAAIISNPAIASSNLTAPTVTTSSPASNTFKTSTTASPSTICKTSTTTSPSTTCKTSTTTCETSTTTSTSTTCITTPTPNSCRCGGSCPSYTPKPPTAPGCEPSCSTPVVPPSTPKLNSPIRPCVTSQYDVWTGAVRRNESKGKIFKDGRKTDVTTLLTFNFPPETEGKTCSFHFDPAATVSGTGQFDVFVSLAPATYSADTWPSGDLRDQHIGRMAAHSDKPAEWLSGFPVFGQSFPCPAGQTYSGELVGVGDTDHVEWPLAVYVCRQTWVNRSLQFVWPAKIQSLVFQVLHKSRNLRKCEFMRYAG